MCHQASRYQVDTTFYLGPNDEIDSGPGTILERVLLEERREADNRCDQATT